MVMKDKTVIRFEVGKRYTDNSGTYEIMSRSDKMIKIVFIHHPNRVNEKLGTVKKVKLNAWGNEEIFFDGCHEIHALEGEVK